MDGRTGDAMVEPRTVDEARNVVEQSRQRISHTLAALEERIVEKKQELKDRADVFRPVREQVEQRPFTAVAVAIGVGALLGSLGGSDEQETSHRRGRGRDHSRRDHSLSDAERAELREWRAHRRERLQSLRRDAHEDTDDRGGSKLDSMRHQLMGAVTTAIGAAVTAKVKSLAAGHPSGNGREDGRISAR